MKIFAAVLAGLFLICPSFAFCGESRDMQAWKDSNISAAFSIFDGDMKKADFSGIFADSRTPYLGYIDPDYQRMDITVTEVKKLTDTDYAVKGNSKVKSNVCDFEGIIKITDIRELENYNTGLDGDMAGKVKKEGLINASYVFKENASQKGSGEFSGELISWWYVDNDGRLLYDDISDYSDDYKNNQFLGHWTSYKTKKSKTAAWGHYRIPCSGALDIGAAEFSPDEKYAKNGWK